MDIWCITELIFSIFEDKTLFVNWYIKIIYFAYYFLKSKKMASTKNAVPDVKGIVVGYSLSMRNKQDDRYSAWLGNICSLSFAIHHVICRMTLQQYKCNIRHTLLC